MAHTHHSHHDHGGEYSSQRILLFSIVLNLLFVGAEAATGLVKDSLSLLSDAGHNLSDVFSLVLVWAGMRLAKVSPRGHYTYGYKKSTVLISLLNAVILLVAVGAIVIESVHKFRSPSVVDGTAVSWTAGVGIVINGLTTVLLMRDRKNDLNMRGAFLHMAADTLVSVGVVVSGVVITYTGWGVVDPLVSLVIAFVILFSTAGLLSGSLRLSLDGTPEGIEPEAVNQLLAATAHVREVHHLHIWAISTTENALTAHVVIDDAAYWPQVRDSLRSRLAECGITHATLEPETEVCRCGSMCCG